MFEALADSISRYRLAWTVAVCFGVIALGSGAINLRPDMSFSAFFSGDDPAKATMDVFTEYWGVDDATLIVLAEHSGDGLLTPKAMQHLATLTDAIRELDSISQVTSLVSMDRMRNEEDSLIVENIYDTMPEDPAELATWRESLLNDTTIVPSILSADGRSTALMAKLSTGSDKIDILIPVVNAFREAIAPYDNQHGISLRTAGIPAIRKDFSETFFTDVFIYGLLGGFLVAVVLYIQLHSFQGMVVTGVAAMVPLIMLLGFMGFDGSTIDVVNQCLFTILPAIAAADAIHLISRFHEEARRIAPAGQRLDHHAKSTALRRSLKHLGRACFLTSFTTAVGFASLNFAEMPILRQFGIYAAVGVSFAYLSVLCLVPLVLHWTRGSVEDIGDESTDHPTEATISAVVQRVIRKPFLVLGVAFVVIVAFSYFATWVKVDNHLSQTLNADHPTSIASKVIDKNMGGILQSALDIQGPPGTLKRPEVLQALDAYLQEVIKLENIRAVASPATLIREAHQQLTGRASIPDDPRAVAQLYLLIENHSEIEDLLSLDYARGRAVMTSEDIGALGFEVVEEELRALMRKHFGKLDVSIELTGTPVVAYRGINRVTEDLRSSLLFAFFVVASVIAVVFRSVRLALISLAPNGIPLLIGYGMLGLFNYRLDPTAALIFTVGLGIAVDDTIHLLARYREEIKKHADHDAALTAAVSRSGRAIWVTTVILVIGLGVNLISAFAPIQAMALAGVTIVSSAFICDITVLPALLKLTLRQKEATPLPS